jgi:hypothetical protein
MIASKGQMISYEGKIIANERHMIAYKGQMTADVG